MHLWQLIKAKSKALKNLLRLLTRGYGLWGMVFQFLVVVIGCLWWLKTSPPPGEWIAILAFVAVIMTVRADKFTMAERVVWVVIGGLLLSAEVTVIHRDRAEALMQQRTENNERERKYEATMKEFAKVLTDTKRALELEQEQLSSFTGGNSFAFARFDPDSQIGTFFKQGKYPLFGVMATIEDFGPFHSSTVGRLTSMITGQPAPGSAEHTQEVRTLDQRKLKLDDYAAGSPDFSNKDIFSIERQAPYFKRFEPESDHSMKLKIIFEARNGRWIEDYWFEKIPMALAPDRADLRHWTQAMRVWRSDGKKERGILLLEQISKEFPKKSLEEFNALRLHPDSIKHRAN
jgi:hypothetical protein